MFIVFEWVDGSGKDTQLNKVFEYLGEKNKNLQIWKTKEPTGYTKSGKEILGKLKWEWFWSAKEAIDLYVMDREEQTVIRKEILKHSCILCSRFDYSTYTYQWLQWLSFEEVYEAHNYQNIILPDITFIFNVSKENIALRLAARWWEKEFFEDVDMLEDINWRYLQVAESLKDERKIFIIDANMSRDDVFEQVRIILDRELWDYDI